jgi:hypothetical protein
MPEVRRVHSGPIQFGQDWPGIFMRGDQALGTAIQLEAFLERGGPSGRATVKRLIEFLRSCDTRTNPKVQMATLLDDNNGSL